MAGLTGTYDAIAVDAPGTEHRVSLSTLPSGRREHRLVVAVLLLSIVVFACTAPFAKLALSPVPAFLPAYQSALVINDLITAVLLFGQFTTLCSPALLVLASAYLFSGTMAVFHALSFPGLFAPAGIIGGGGQTTAWLYFLWHGSFPLMVVAYAVLRTRAPGRPSAAVMNRREIRGKIAAAAVGAVALACGLALLATAGHDLFPPIMQGDQDGSTKVFVATACWALSLISLVTLWRRRPHSVVDLWLIVVMCAWILDIALASVLNGARYDLGWYAGRVYGLLAASFVLAVLLLENSALHARLLGAQEREHQRAQETLAQHAERLRLMRSVDDSIAAGERIDALAAAVIRPLRDLLGVPRAIVNMFDLEAGLVEWLAAAGRSRVHVGPGVRYSIRMMGDVEALKRGEPQKIDTRALPAGPDTDSLLASGIRHYLVVPMIAGGELIGAISYGDEAGLFPAGQVAIAEEVATQLAIAITQSRLLDRVRRQAEELELRVRERTAELQAANRELEGFSYSVSHDLRAPLRAVDGYAQMLEEDYAGRLEGEGRRLLGVVRSEAARMGCLIDDLLRFSQLGRRQIVRAPFAMRALVEEVVVELSPAFPKARIELGALPDASGDRALLKQVWTNFVANALKYSSRREDPRVEIGGSEAEGESTYWVRDNGAGFDMRYKDKLFKVFQRLHRQDEFEGTGVGLAIVERVVARHGGRVWADSAPGEGACFRFAVPKGA